MNPSIASEEGRSQFTFHNTHVNKDKHDDIKDSHWETVTHLFCMTINSLFQSQ